MQNPRAAPVSRCSGLAPGTRLLTMQRVCFVLQVKKDRLEEYAERHRMVWPEMQEALRETGWHNYSIFLRDDGLVIGYLETPDFEQALAAMAAREVNTCWQRQMREFFEDSGRDPDRQIEPLRQIFFLP